MPDEPPDPFAKIALGHRVIHRDRADQLKRRPGRKTSRPECTVLGHAWASEHDREGWLICIACDAVRQD